MKSLLGCSAAAMLCWFGGGCLSTGTLPGEGLFQRRDASPARSVMPRSEAFERPVSRRIPSAKKPTEDVEAELDEPAPERDPFWKRKRSSLEEEPGEFADFQLTETNPRSRAEELLAEAEAIERQGNRGSDAPAMATRVPLIQPDEPLFEGVEGLLYTMEKGRVFASSAGLATGTTQGYQIRFQEDGSGTLQVLSAGSPTTKKFQWIYDGEVRLLGGPSWPLPNVYELHPHKGELYLLPREQSTKLKETLGEEGALRPKDLNPEFVFDAVDPTFRRVKNRTSARAAVVGKPSAAAADRVLPLAASLQGGDRALRLAMDRVGIPIISWTARSSLDDTVDLLNTVWLQSANADTPPLRLVAERSLRTAGTPGRTFTSRTQMTFAQILQEFAEQREARVVIEGGIVRLVSQ